MKRGCRLTAAEAKTVILLGEAFMDEGCYLLDGTGEKELMTRLLKIYPEVEVPLLVEFLAKGKLPKCVNGKGT